MPLDFFKVGELIRCEVSIRTGDASAEDVQIVAVFKRDGQKQERVLKSSLSNLVVAGDRVTFNWDTTDALDKEEFLLVYALEARGSTIWGRKKVVVYRPTIEVQAVDKQNQPVEGAVCRLAIKPDFDFQLSGRKYDTIRSMPVDDGLVWTRATDREGRVVFEELPVGELKLEWVKPHILTEVGWKAEGEFTKTGPKRKAEIKKAPLIHFVWWGGETGEEPAPTATPNSVAQLKTLVKYWGQAGIVDAGLNTEIRVRPITSITDLFDSDDGFTWHPFFMGRARQIDLIIQTMAAYKIYSAINLLIGLCVMFKEGGYCFNPKAGISDSGRIENLEPHDTPRIVRAGKRLGKSEGSAQSSAAKDQGQGDEFFFYLNDRTADGTYETGLAATDSLGLFQSKRFAVWAMYAPPRHPALLLMAASFVERCEHLGLDADPQTSYISSLGKSVHDVLSESPAAVNGREHLIDNLVMCAVQEGLVRFVREDLGMVASFGAEGSEFGLSPPANSEG